MGIRGLGVRGLFCKTVFLVLVVATAAQAKTRYILDFDGTIVNDHGERAGWKTYWILKRIDKLHASVQPNPHKSESAPYIQLSFEEYRRLMPLLGKEEGMLGELTSQTLDKDPVLPERQLSFIPGLYRVSPDLTFTHYRPGVDGTNFLLRDYRDAKKRELASRKLNWRGLAFPLLQAALSDTSTVGDLIVSSARGHTDEEFQALLSALKKDGEISYASYKERNKDIVRPRTHFLQDPESILFGRSLVEKKTNVVSEEATQLLNGPFEPHEELVTDEYQAKEGKTAMLHSLIVAEDDPRYVAAITKTLENLSSDLHYGHRIKFVLFNAGNDEEVATTRWGYRWTVFDRGFGREALPSEIAVWTKSNSKKSCEALLRGEYLKGRRS